MGLFSQPSNFCLLFHAPREWLKYKEERIWQKVEYESLPTICNLCGMLGQRAAVYNLAEGNIPGKSSACLSKHRSRSEVLYQSNTAATCKPALRMPKGISPGLPHASIGWLTRFSIIHYSRYSANNLIWLIIWDPVVPLQRVSLQPILFPPASDTNRLLAQAWQVDFYRT